MIYVFGGISLDLIFTRKKFIPGTSNPSDLSYRIGGVCYNIFNFLEIEEKICISSLGKDLISGIIINLLKDRKYNICKVEGKIGKNIIEKIEYPSIILTIDDKHSGPIYNALMEEGNCYIATSDFKVIEKQLKFSKLESLLDNIKDNDLVVFDSNILPEELDKIFNKLSKCGCKIFFETISLEKAQRIKTKLNNIFFTAPDIHEFNALIENSDSIYDYMEKQNIEYILKTEGKNGAKLYNKTNKNCINFKPKKQLKVKDTTGAGDFLFSKIIESYFKGFSIEKSIEIAMDKVLDYLIQLNKGLN